MQKVIELSHATLEPTLLFGTNDAVATHGKVHAQAHSAMLVEGQRYALAEQGTTSDVLIGVPELAQRARELFRDIAQHIADAAGAPVEYKVNGQPHTVQPAPKK